MKIDVWCQSQSYGILKNKLEWAELLISMKTSVFDQVCLRSFAKIVDIRWYMLVSIKKSDFYRAQYFSKFELLRNKTKAHSNTFTCVTHLGHLYSKT